MLPDGYYAVPYPSGNYRLLWLKTVKGDLGPKDAWTLGKRILYYKLEADGNRARPKHGWKSFAFLDDNDAVQFYVKFARTCTAKQLDSIRQAVAEIAVNPQQASELFESAAGIKSK